MAKSARSLIKQYLKHQSQTQEWLAAELGISTTYLSMILSEQRTCSLDVAVKLEKLTGHAARQFVSPTMRRLLDQVSGDGAGA